MVVVCQWLQTKAQLVSSPGRWTASVLDCETKGVHTVESHLIISYLLSLQELTLTLFCILIFVCTDLSKQRSVTTLGHSSSNQSIYSQCHTPDTTLPPSSHMVLHYSGFTTPNLLHTTNTKVDTVNLHSHTAIMVCLLSSMAHHHHLSNTITTLSRRTANHLCMDLLPRDHTVTSSSSCTMRNCHMANSLIPTRSSMHTVALLLLALPRANHNLSFLGMLGVAGARRRWIRLWLIQGVKQSWGLTP